MNPEPQTLKRYQRETLDALRLYLEEARVAGAAAAFDKITAEPERAARLGRRRPYRPLPGLEETPYVCLRLPTGGGKTVLAARAAAIARDAWMETDRPLVLWLTPTKTIRLQTAEALKNLDHPYRRALDDAFDGHVRVFDIADFAHVRPRDLEANCCVVVGTIQALRVKDTVGRKVYAHHEDMEPHFARLRRFPAGLERLDDGGPKFSFANLLHIHRPLTIVDEAHNAVTGLTREMQARLNPSAIVEFTATPRADSNILHAASAQDLKDEEMIKLPVVLREHDSWQAAVNGAVAKRAELAEAARRDPDGVRPIALFQAQDRAGEVPAAVLRRHLIEAENVPEEKIAVATGEQRELDGIDLLDPRCPIEHVVTVKALKEGWDCSFAYVFCSVSRIQSATDVEQLLGRVLRMPFARRRREAALNRAYAFVSEPSFGRAAHALADKLTKMGFDEEEARENIEPAGYALDLEGGLFDRKPPGKPVFAHVVPAPADTLAALAALDGVTARAAAGGGIEIEVEGWIGDGLEAGIADVVPPAARPGLAEAAARYRAEVRNRLSPAARGEPFIVPGLAARIQGELEIADTDIFMEWSDWSILDHPFLPRANEFELRETSRGFEIDIGGGRPVFSYAGEEEAPSLDFAVEGWTAANLAAWLDKRLRAPDIAQGDLLRWSSDLVRHLTVRRGIAIAALTRCKFVLARAARDAIAAARENERGRAYRAALFEPDARPEISFDMAFAFRDGMYEGQRLYRGPWWPNRHFLGPNKVPAFDGAAGGEEEQCARAIDSLPRTRFWIRNIANHPASFRLPLANGRFYPDFAVELTDGRLLVVEYKGAHLADTPDTAEKEAVGALWERQSGGKCLFLTATESAEGRDAREQLLRKVGG